MCVCVIRFLFGCCLRVYYQFNVNVTPHLSYVHTYREREINRQTHQHLLLMHTHTEAPLPPKITTIESLTERTSLTWTHNTVCFNTSDIEYVVSWVDLASGGGLNGRGCNVKIRCHRILLKITRHMQFKSENLVVIGSMV